MTGKRSSSVEIRLGHHSESSRGAYQLVSLSTLTVTLTVTRTVTRTRTPTRTPTLTLALALTVTVTVTLLLTVVQVSFSSQRDGAGDVTGAVGVCHEASRPSH